MRYRRKVSSYSVLQVLPDGCDNNACSLLARLFHEQPAHYGTVVVVQVADGFVQEDKVERLAKAADKSDALLLPEGKLAGSFVGFVGNAGCFEKGENFFFFLWLVRRFFNKTFSRAVTGEDTQFLEKDAERMFPYICPFADGE